MFCRSGVWPAGNQLSSLDFEVEKAYRFNIGGQVSVEKIQDKVSVSTNVIDQTSDLIRRAINALVVV